MPQLGLGLGLHKNNFIRSALAELKSAGATFLVDPRFADGQPWTKLEPRTLPNGVSNTAYTKNVSDDVVLQASDVISLTIFGDVNLASITLSVLSGILGSGTGDIVATKIYTNRTTPRNSRTLNNPNNTYMHYLNLGNWVITLPTTVTTLKQARELLAGTVIRYQLATPIDTLNVPFINPLTDQAGDADVTLQGFAQTPESGYALRTNGDKSFVMTVFDGADDRGLLNAESAPNPTGTQDFAQLVVFKPESFVSYYGLVRNLDATPNVQYGLLSSGAAGNPLAYVINGNVFNLSPNTVFELQWVLYGRINGRRFGIHNGIETGEASFTTSITTRPNVQMNCRSNSADGLTKAFFAKGDQGACVFFYDGDNPLDKAKIVDYCKKFVKSVYGFDFPDHIYGVQWDKGASPTLTRTDDSVGGV